MRKAIATEDEFIILQNTIRCNSRCACSKYCHFRLFCAVGCIGNIIVILVYHLRMKMDRRSGRRFVLPLSYVDLLGSVSVGLHWTTVDTNPDSFTSEILCKAPLYLLHVTSGSSVLLLSVIAVQRYQKLCRPFGYQMSRKVQIFAVCFCVGFGFLACLPVAIFAGLEKEEVNGLNITASKCSVNPSYNTGYAIYNSILWIILAIALISIFVFYLHTARTIFYRYVKNTHTVTSKDMDKDDPSQNTEKSINNPSKNASAHKNQHIWKLKTLKDRPQIRISVMFFIISILGLIFYLPSPILFIIRICSKKAFDDLYHSSPFVLFLLRRLYILNHVSNPIIYNIFDTKFRLELRHLLCLLRDSRSEDFEVSSSAFPSMQHRCNNKVEVTKVSFARESEGRTNKYTAETVL